MARNGDGLRGRVIIKTRSLIYNVSLSFYTLGVANTTHALGIDLCLVNAEARVLDRSNHHPKLPFRFFGADILGYNLDK